MIERVKYHFDACHRLSNHKGKCRNLHGHGWEVEIFIQGEMNKETGMIIDFGIIKEIINYFDHKIMLYSGDSFNLKLIDLLDEYGLKYIKLDNEPTAEFLAKNIFDRLTKLLRPDVKIKINLWESPGCVVEYGYKIEN